MEEERTTDSILSGLEKMVRERLPIDPYVWMQAALDLNILMGDEHAKLYQMQHEIARKRASIIGTGKSVAAANVEIEASTEHRDMMLQKAKVDRINETIRVAKLQARLAAEEMRNG